MRSPALTVINAGASRTDLRSRVLRPSSARAPVVDTADAAVSLASELLSLDRVSIAVLTDAVERLRHRAHALNAAVWVLNETSATCVLHIGNTSAEGGAPPEFGGDPLVLERLRRCGALICRADEVSGVEPLVPLGARSFVVVTAPNGTEMVVLVIGWKAPQPPCDDMAVIQLRLAAALLQRVLVKPPREQSAVSHSILSSLANPVVVVDSEGTIAAVNQAWTTLAQEREFVEPFGVGANYFEILRRRSANGSPEMPSIVEGIRAVATGEKQLIQAAFACELRGVDQWYVLTATPLRDSDAGAVISHSGVTIQEVTELADRMTERRLQLLIDSIPIAIWAVTREGRFRCGNERWIELVGDSIAEGAEWAEAFHPEDRARVAEALLTSTSSRKPFEIEVRLKDANSRYRWFICGGAAQGDTDGQVQGIVGFCWDISATRHAEWALREMASKLVAAQEDERSRIGRELHDDLGQQASLVAAQLDSLAHNPRLSRDRMHDGLIESAQSLQGLAADIHNLSHQLHPAKLKLLGLVNTLEGLCRELARQSNAQVRFSASGVPSYVPEPIALCIFRVAQEALQNEFKHSGATEIEVALTATSSELTLRVSDKGHGFDPLAPKGAGIGLLTMRERVDLSGGRLRIDTAPGSGTTVEATLPLNMIDSTDSESPPSA
jgi:PAS domain S-box-containing protein